MSTVTLLQGDCLQKLKELEDNSIDSVVTDPPYHLTSIVKRFGKDGSAEAQYGTDGAFQRASKGFMGKEWDGLGEDGIGIANNPELWKEVLRVLKPGGHLLSFSHSRTYHRQAVAVEDAGFEIRDQILWIYGSGFPKSRNIGKDIEKIKVGGIKNLKQVGTKQGIKVETGTSGYSYSKEYVPGKSMGGKQISGDIPVYEITNEWGGWGTALKPAHEPIVMARKPFKGSVAQNVLEWGTGGINVDGCRIGNETRTVPVHIDDVKEDNTLFGLHPTIQHERVETTQGRFPANIIFDEEAGKILDEQSGITKSGKSTGLTPTKARSWKNSSKEGINRIGHNDEAGASRFFYCPKASKKDRNEGNIHPTVKPTDLMAYLVRMITPKGGIVLDPFMGSGSTGKAAVREGFDFVGIEREDEYMEIAKSRIEYEKNKNKHRNFFDYE
jgi:site-specific DNA-methyltransferase (adenine-specific)